MTKDNFLLKLEDELELDTKLTLETNIKDIEEWDSMTAMVLIGILSNEFGISLKLEEIESLTTINSIIERVGVGHFN